MELGARPTANLRALSFTRMEQYNFYALRRKRGVQWGSTITRCPLTMVDRSKEARVGCIWGFSLIFVGRHGS